MDSARWTSPQLSRDLRDAGLVVAGPGEHYHGTDERLCAMHWSWCEMDPSPTRALDLTDVLDALTREREGGPLIPPQPSGSLALKLVYAPGFSSLGDWEVWGVRDEVSPWSEEDDHWITYGHSPVEAAGRVLLALLRERKVPK